MGSILTPLYQGIEKALDLPQAATLCNQCGVVCPVKIPLPDLMRTLREKQLEMKLRPLTERWALKLWGMAAKRPWAYAFASRIVSRFLRWKGGPRGRIRSAPGLSEWTRGRDLPAPAGPTFRALYARRGK